MGRYFDKTFFRFLTSFLLILLASFAVIVAVGYYSEEKGTEVEVPRDTVVAAPGDAN